MHVWPLTLSGNRESQFTQSLIDTGKFSNLWMCIISAQITCRFFSLIRLGPAKIQQLGYLFNCPLRYFFFQIRQQFSTSFTHASRCVTVTPQDRPQILALYSTTILPLRLESMNSSLGHHARPTDRALYLIDQYRR